MSNFFNLSKSFALWVSFILISACSVSDSGVSGIEGTGDIVAAKGSVTQFGSIYVNGIHFNTDNTQFKIADEDVDEASIKQGMVVYVEGTPGASDTEASAQLVTFDYIVKGKIEDIVNTTSNQRYIALLGYTISTTEDATIEGGDFNQLSVGDYISVSGFIDNNNHILATRIDVSTETSSIEISGSISSINIDSQTLTINQQIIDYSTTTFTGGNLNNLKQGVSIKIKGSLNPETTNISASSIYFIKNEHEHKAEKISTEGIIKDFTSIADFRLNGVKIDATSANLSTRDLAQLANGQRITIKGIKTNNGDIIAHSAHLHLQSSTRISGQVTDIDTETKTFRLSGIDFYVDAFTNYEDTGPQKNRYFSLENLSVGEFLDIFSLIYNDKHVAVTVRRKPNEYNSHTLIKGKITAFIDDKLFQLLDITINAEAIDENTLAELDFETTIVIKGQYSDDSTFTASEIYILKSNCTSYKEDDCSKQRSAPRRPGEDGNPFENGNPFDEGGPFDKNKTPEDEQMPPWDQKDSDNNSEPKKSK